MSNSYSREQISRLLNKASHIQARLDRMGNAEGLSEKELFELGSEVGLSKQAILEAINELSDEQQIEKKFKWIKGSSQLQFDQVIFGDLGKADREKVIAEIRAVTGGIGKVGAPSPGQLEWEQRRSEVGYKHITLSTEENGRIRLRYNYNWGGLKLALSVVGPTIAMALLTIVGKGAGLNEYKGLFALGGIIAGFVAGRFYLKSYFEEQKSKFKELKSSLSQLFQKEKGQSSRSQESENKLKDTIPILDSIELEDKVNEETSEVNRLKQR